MSEKQLLGICILALIFGLIFWISYDFATKEHVCDQFKEVSSIGGCDSSGVCGVSFTDGTFGSEIRPVVGQHLCVKREWRKR